MHLRSGLKKLQDDSDPERISSFYSFLMFSPWCLYLYVFTKHNSVHLPLVSRILKVEWTKKNEKQDFHNTNGNLELSIYTFFQASLRSSIFSPRRIAFYSSSRKEMASSWFWYIVLREKHPCFLIFYNLFSCSSGEHPQTLKLTHATKFQVSFTRQRLVLRQYMDTLANTSFQCHLWKNCMLLEGS